MKAQSKPKPTDHYSKRNAERFLAENFAANQVMRWRLTGLIDGIREAEYRRGYRQAVSDFKNNPL